MKIPNREQLPNMPIFDDFIRNDREGFCSTKRSNKSFLNKRRIQTSLDLFKKFLPKGNQEICVADLASGTGNFGLSLLDDGYKVDFYDNETNFFTYIKEKVSPEKKEMINFFEADVSKLKTDKKYHGVFLGEAIEHMARPDEMLKSIYDILLPGGVFCLTTPNGDYVDCAEPSWEEVKDSHERNAKLANSIGNHVCEFRKKELAELVKAAGFGLHKHILVNSRDISKRSLLRRILPMSILFEIDSMLAKKKDANGNDLGRNQIIVAQRFH